MNDVDNNNYVEIGGFKIVVQHTTFEGSFERESGVGVERQMVLNSLANVKTHIQNGEKTTTHTQESKMSNPMFFCLSDGPISNKKKYSP